jgi:hypothetical protein
LDCKTLQLYIIFLEQTRSAFIIGETNMFYAINYALDKALAELCEQARLEMKYLRCLKDTLAACPPDVARYAQEASDHLLLVQTKALLPNAPDIAVIEGQLANTPQPDAAVLYSVRAIEYKGLYDNCMQLESLYALQALQVRQRVEALYNFSLENKTEEVRRKEKQVNDLARMASPTPEALRARRRLLAPISPYPYSYP